MKKNRKNEDKNAVSDLLLKVEKLRIIDENIKKIIRFKSELYYDEKQIEYDDKDLSLSYDSIEDYAMNFKTSILYDIESVPGDFIRAFEVDEGS